MESAELESRLRKFFALDAHGAIAAYLFGSIARNAGRPDSDVDVAILYAADPPATFEGLPLRLEGELEKCLGRKVEVVVLNTAPPDLVHRVLRDGKLLLELDRRKRIRFEVKSRNEFWDIEPFLHRYRGDEKVKR